MHLQNFDIIRIVIPQTAQCEHHAGEDRLYGLFAFTGRGKGQGDPGLIFVHPGLCVLAQHIIDGTLGKLDGRGNYTLGIHEQIIFPEINIDNVDRIQGMNITFVTTAKTDEEGFALLKAFGLPFKNSKND